MSRLRVSREFSLAVQYVLDQWLPPRLRDSRWLMWLPMKLLFRGHATTIMDFKKRAFAMSQEEFAEVYRSTADVGELQGETDLNPRCTEAILTSLAGSTALEVGAGRGYLANLMSESMSVTASDIVVNEQLRKRFGHIEFVEANIEQLPFPDASFDTVVCTHTLEHVQRLGLAIAELRRVTRRRLIIVVPKQRPYWYSFSLHINFFPYDWSLQAQLGYREGAVIRDLGDWFYVEDVAQSGVS